MSSARIAVVETIAMTAGLAPLRIAARDGVDVIFVAADLERYQGLMGIEEALSTCVDVVQVDTSDEKALFNALRGSSLDGVMTVCDYFIPQVASVAHQLGLPGLDVRAAHAVRDKSIVRQLTEDAGVPGARHAVVALNEDLATAIERIGLPCVVKPVDESASNGVTLCVTAAEVEATVGRILGRGRNARGQDTPSVALIEEFLVGPEVSVELLIPGTGQASALGVTDKRIGPPPSFVELGHVFPSAQPQESKVECEDVARRAVQAVGLDFGAAHVEIKVTKDGPRLVEVNPRLAGDWIPTLIESATGFPVLSTVIGMHLGRPVADVAPAAFRSCAVQFTTSAPRSGVSESRLGKLGDILPDVLSAEWYPGHSGGVSTSNHDRTGHVIACGPNQAAAVLMAECGASHMSVFSP